MRKRDLIERCERLRGSVLARGLATEAEVEAEWPDDGPRSRMDDWVHAYANLVAFRRREEWHATGREEAEEEALAALREAPVTVELIDPPSPGRRSVDVYPKGLEALMWLRSAEYLLGWVEARVEALEQLEEDGTLELDEGVALPGLLERARAESTEQLARIVAQAVTPGPALVDVDADAPDWIRALNPVDLVRLHRAWLEVNIGRLEAVRRITKPPKPGEKKGERPSWTGFLTGITEKGGDPWRRARDRSLCALLTQAQVSRPDMDEELEKA